MQVPDWWLIVSAIFFVLGSLSFLATVALMMAVMKVLKDVKPKIDALSAQAESIAKKVDGIATKVDQIADSAKSTVDTVGGGAKNMANSLMSTLTGGARKIESVSSTGMWIMTAIKLFEQISAIRRSAKAREDAHKSAKLALSPGVDNQPVGKR